jgi:phosphoribosylformylglycinamidine cyclo-ligase
VLPLQPIDGGQFGAYANENPRAYYQENFIKYSSDAIHGMVHCSGGAQTKILHFVQNLHIIKDNLFPVPPS